MSCFCVYPDEDSILGWVVLPDIQWLHKIQSFLPQIYNEHLLRTWLHLWARNHQHPDRDRTWKPFIACTHSQTWTRKLVLLTDAFTGSQKNGETSLRFQRAEIVNVKDFLYSEIIFFLLVKMWMCPFIYFFNRMATIADDNWICFHIHCWPKVGNPLSVLWCFGGENFYCPWNTKSGEFPGSPVVRTPSFYCFHCWGHGFNPWWRN